MTPYYMTFGLLAFFLVMFELSRPAVDFEGNVASARRLSRFFLLCAGLVLVTVAGLRFQVGSDYGGYVSNFPAYKESFVDDLWSFNEPGIKGLANIAAWIWDDPAAYILLSSVVTIGLMLRAYALYSPSVALSFIIFVLAGPWVGSFNGVRQYLACAVILAGHRFILERRPALFGLVVLCAGLFHLSALAALLLYFVPRRRLGPFGLVVVVMLSLATLNSSEAVLGLLEDVKGEPLNSPYVTSAIAPMRIAVALAPLALFVMSRPREAAPDEWFYRNFAVVHAAVLVAASFSAYVGRFGIYTGAFVPLFLPYLVKFSNARATSLARVAVVVLYGVYWYMDVAPSIALNNYQWIFAR